MAAGLIDAVRAAAPASSYFRDGTTHRRSRSRRAKPSKRGALIEAHFRDALTSASLEDADGLAQEAYVLMVGAVAASATRGNADPARRPRSAFDGSWRRSPRSDPSSPRSPMTGARPAPGAGQTVEGGPDDPPMPESPGHRK